MYIPKVPRSMKIQSRSNQAVRQHGWLTAGNVGPEFNRLLAMREEAVGEYMTTWRRAAGACLDVWCTRSKWQLPGQPHLLPDPYGWLQGPAPAFCMWYSTDNLKPPIYSVIWTRCAVSASNKYKDGTLLAFTRRWITVGLTLVRRRRRRTNVKPIVIQRLVSAGVMLNQRHYVGETLSQHHVFRIHAIARYFQSSGISYITVLKYHTYFRM